MFRWFVWSGLLQSEWLARCLTRCLARVLTRVRGGKKCTNTVHSTTRCKEKHEKVQWIYNKASKHISNYNHLTLNHQVAQESWSNNLDDQCQQCNCWMQRLINSRGHCFNRLTVKLIIKHSRQAPRGESRSQKIFNLKRIGWNGQHLKQKTRLAVMALMANFTDEIMANHDSVSDSGHPQWF